MRKTWGGLGTRSGLMLRIWQIFFASVSFLAMVCPGDVQIERPFAYIMQRLLFLDMMAFIVLWSFSLAWYNAYILRKNADLQAKLVYHLALGDLALSIPALALTCSTTGNMAYLHEAGYCKKGNHLQCSMINLSLFCGFFAWGQVALSFHIALWSLASPP